MAEQNPAFSSPNIPPPPAEVKVRTMRSDIDGIAKSGGGSPQFKTVPVEGMKLAKSQVGGEIPQGRSSGSPFPWWILIIGIVALGIVLYFAYVLFVVKK